MSGTVATARQGATLSGLAAAITGRAEDWRRLDFRRDPGSLRPGDRVDITPLLPRTDEVPMNQEARRQPPVAGVSADFVRRLRSFIEEWEGRRRRAYRDTQGYWTIGVGYNLSARRQEIERILPGVSYRSLIEGRSELTDEQIDILFDYTIAEDILKATRWLPNFGDLPEEVRLIVVDFAHNVRDIRDWPELRQALIRRDYTRAAQEMNEPGYVNVTGRRARHHMAVLEELGRTEREKNR